MRFYPVSLDISDKQCLVVGGGAVGTRKIKTLLKCGAEVTAVSRVFSYDLPVTPRLTLLQRDYRKSDLNNKFLVICSTDNQNLNRKISEDAGEKNVLCNIADNPDNSDFILPSIINKGDLTITISTAGKSPAFSKRLRRELEEQFGDEYALFLELMGILRKRLLSEEHAPEKHRKQFQDLIESGLLNLIRSGDTARIDKLFLRVLGNGYSYNDLMKNKDCSR